jgi:hypothetical protein
VTNRDFRCPRKELCRSLIRRASSPRKFSFMHDTVEVFSENLEELQHIFRKDSSSGKSMTRSGKLASWRRVANFRRTDSRKLHGQGWPRFSA